MDNSFEQCVRKPDYTKEEKKFKLFTVFMVLSAVGAAIGLVFLLLGLYVFGAVLLVMWLAVTLCFYKMRDNAIIEYDYEFIDGVISVSRISHGSKRKLVVSVPIEQLKSIAPVNQHELQNVGNDGSKTIYCYLNDDSRLYLLKGVYKGQAVTVVWEPKQALLKLIRSERINVVTL